MEDHDQDVYGALEKNMNLKEQIKQKLRKYIREKAETNTMKQCKALAEANKIWMNEHEVKKTEHMIKNKHTTVHTCHACNKTFREIKYLK